MNLKKKKKRMINFRGKGFNSLMKGEFVFVFSYLFSCQLTVIPTLIYTLWEFLSCGKERLNSLPGQWDNGVKKRKGRILFLHWRILNLKENSLICREDMNKGKSFIHQKFLADRSSDLFNIWHLLNSSDSSIALLTLKTHGGTRCMGQLTVFG